MQLKTNSSVTKSKIKYYNEGNRREKHVVYKDKISIGMMAKINGVSEQALRLYDKIDLLQPIEINPETGYRYYDIKQSAQLNKIQYLKALGMNLSQIKKFFEIKHTEELTRLLELQMEDIDKKITEMKNAKQALQRTLLNYDRFHEFPKEGDVVSEYLAARKIFCFNAGANYFTSSTDEYEYSLCQLKEAYKKYSLPTYCFDFNNVGSVLRKEYFLNQELHSIERFLLLKTGYDGKAPFEIIRGGLYLCVYCYDRSNIANQIKLLMDYVDSNDYQLLGDCLIESLIEFQGFNERRSFIKVQLPVK